MISVRADKSVDQRGSAETLCILLALLCKDETPRIKMETVYKHGTHQ